MIEKVKNEPVIFMFRKMWKFSEGNRKNIILFLILFLFSNAVVLLNPLVFEALLNEIQHNGVTENNLTKIGFYLLSFLGLSLFFWGFHGPARVLERKNAIMAEMNYVNYLVEIVLSQKLSWHAEKDSGDTIDKIYYARNALFDFSQSFYNFISIFIKTIGTLVIISFFNIYITLFLLVFIAGAIFLITFFDEKLIPQYTQLQLYQNKISARIFDSLSNITSVVILNIKEKVGKDIKKSVDKPLNLFVKNTILNEQKWFTLNVFIEFVFLVPVGFYIYTNYKAGNVVEVGSITALYMYLKNIASSFFDFGGRYEGVVKQKTQILNAKEIEYLNRNFSEKIQQRFSHWEKIKIKSLKFSYTGEKNDIDIQDILLEKGQKIAIIGESGGGKTTFLKTLHGLYPSVKSESEIFSGKISEKFLETNFSDINIESMLVPQEPELFSSTIEENITFGMEFSDSEISEVLEISRAKEFVENLPDGLKSVVNEKGVNLSGGQKQRIALARALLFAQKKQLILLDESTSSVDPENETLIYQNIFQKFSHTTIIASIHKMNLLKYFDTIVIFNEGKISDSGTFDELLQKNSNFKKDWEKYIASQK